MAQMTLDTEWVGHLDGNYDAPIYKLSGLEKQTFLRLVFLLTQWE